MTVAEQLKQPETPEQRYERRVTFHVGEERAKRQAKRLVDAEEQPPRPPLKALDLAELFTLPPPAYIIDQFITENGLVQVVGEPGVGKTFFMLDAALSIASGQPSFFNLAILKHAAVLYIAAEGAGALQFRIRAWCHERGVDLRDLADTFRVIPLPVNLRDPAFQQELQAIVETIHPVLVVVDTRARCTPGADENSAKEMGEVINFCSALQQTAAVAFVHHPTKSDPRGGGRGSGAIFGALDTEVRIESDDPPEATERAITVTCAKQKDDMPFAPLSLITCVVPVCNFDGDVMMHASGREVTSVVLRMAKPEDEAARADMVRAEEHATDVKVLTAMKRYPTATNQKRLRDRVGLNMAIVQASIERILQREWAVEGRRGEAYQLTPLGLAQLPEEM